MDSFGEFPNVFVGFIGQHCLDFGFRERGKEMDHKLISDRKAILMAAFPSDKGSAGIVLVQSDPLVGNRMGLPPLKFGFVGGDLLNQEEEKAEKAGQWIPWD